MKRFLVSATLGLLTLLVLTFPVAAGRTWCAKDPIVQLNGVPVEIWVAIPEQYLAHVAGPIHVQVNTPAAVERRVTFVDDGFNGYGETVTFGTLDGVVNPDGSFTIQISASIPMAGIPATQVPLRLSAFAASGERIVIEGHANNTQAGLTVIGTDVATIESATQLVTSDPFGQWVSATCPTPLTDTVLSRAEGSPLSLGSTIFSSTSKVTEELADCA